MIDRTERDALSLRLRRLASGRMMNSDFDDQMIYRSEDGVLVAVSDAGWGLYGDYHDYRLRGREALGKEALEAVARCVLFLDSDLPYEWAFLRPTLRGLLTDLVTFGYTSRKKRREWEASGPYRIWPFFRDSDYQAALLDPRRLAGAPEEEAA